ncbi:MAG: hypothetical protein KKA07_16435 [Bacteroidetes bacterium]|nr:hypothetical protein [Bacteroidota bacterium]MBU1720654.1 hypothetical protein [Bacteroidota bacterium]
MSDWWSALTALEKIYWGFAIPSSLAFLIILLMTFIGGDSDHDMDGGADSDVAADHGAGFQFFTIKNLVGFFTIFAWTGLACISAGYSTPVVLIVSIVSGTAMMVAMAAIFYFISKLAETGNLNIRNSIGNIAEVYLPIPATRNGFGKVHLKVQGTFQELEAVTDEETDIPTGSVVVVTDVTTNDLLIVKRSKPN